MKLKIGLLVAVSAMIASAECPAIPSTGKVVGKVVVGAVEREIAKETAKQVVKSSAGGAMSAALAEVTAKQFIGAGVAVGTAVALPVVAYKLTDGPQEICEAKAGAIRVTSEVAAKEIANHPELVEPTLKTLITTQESVLPAWGRRAILGASVIGGIVCLLYLLGAVLRAVAYCKRGVSELSGTGSNLIER